MADEDDSLPSGMRTAREVYTAAMDGVRAAFEAGLRAPGAGRAAVAARAEAVDALIARVWGELPGVGGVALVAVGGYGRQELLPYSDVDLMFLLDAKVEEKAAKEAIRQVNQRLWDCGLRVSAMTRTLAECEKFDAENVEFSLSLLDARVVAGDMALGRKLVEKSVVKLVAGCRKKIAARLLEVTRGRHAKYGGTLFHLEPNVKECPGGLRDGNVCGWLGQLSESEAGGGSAEFEEAREFLLLVRCFLHFRHKRDDNVLDWQSQDEAGVTALGMQRAGLDAGLDAAYWMRFYFRHARAVERRVAQAMDDATPVKAGFLSFGGGKPAGDAAHAAIEVRGGRVRLRDAAGEEEDPAHDPEVALAVFATVARTGARLTQETEARLEQSLPILSARLEDGPGLWRRLQAVLGGPFAGLALRGMHALGILELVMPEFHGIDALVIRDAYHRYTVDEHTFVVIDTLHALAKKQVGVMEGWAGKFGAVLRDLPHPALLYLAALLHDVGKGRATTGHAAESAKMAEHVLGRLELDDYESGLVLDLIRNHLEMSAALRRDVFDQETIRAFAARVQAPEALRMLTLFTYADVAAVHPDALTPWKAENLWRLYGATASFLDRNVDEERVASRAESDAGEVVYRIEALLPGQTAEVLRFLDGFPRRYLQTRTAELVRDHFRMARLCDGGDQVELRYSASMSEVTLVTKDRAALFATMAGVLAAWGMNIVTADAFSNAHGVVVDTFRFTDPFRTLELNEPERESFLQSLRDGLAGKTGGVEARLASRRRGKKAAPKVVVTSRIDFDDAASTHSTLVQVVAQDTPGLLHALTQTFARQACSIEVALVDTEGEMAIDVFYLRHKGAKLDGALEDALRRELLEAVETNGHAG